MAIQTLCYTAIKGRVLRIIAVDECGVPLCGDDPGAGMIVSKGFTQIQQSAQYDTGEEHITRTADADLCVNEKDPDAFKRNDLTIDFCVTDPGVIARTVAPSRLLRTAGIGTGFALGEGISRKRFSLEVWQRVTGPGACDPSGEQNWVYNAWPNLGQGKIGDYNVATAPSVLQIMGESRAASPLWWIGDPWLGDDPVSPIPDHWFQNVTTTPPPQPQCGIQDVPCPESS